MGNHTSCIPTEEALVASVCFGDPHAEAASCSSAGGLRRLEEYGACSSNFGHKNTWRMCSDEVDYIVTSRVHSTRQHPGVEYGSCCADQPRSVFAEIMVDEEGIAASWTHAGYDAPAHAAVLPPVASAGPKLASARGSPGPATSLPVLLQSARNLHSRTQHINGTKDECKNTGEDCAADSTTRTQASTALTEGSPCTASCSSPEAPGSRWRIFRVVIERDSTEESLGVDVAHIEDKLLRVISIDNDNSSAAAEVFQLGDVILQVNGIKGSSDQMVQECALRENLAFRVARPDDEAAAEMLLAELRRPLVPPLKLPQMKKLARR